MDNVKVSIICIAYNHEKYIKDAIESFLMQKTSFEYEILIHDDASTDKTREIIEEYRKKYPSLIKCIYEKENVYSKGIAIFDEIMVPISKGDYLAICEGDDFWNDEYKLQKQYEAMERHPDIDVCSHSSYYVMPSTKKIERKCVASRKNTIFSVNEVIEGNGRMICTNSLFFRKRIFPSKYKFYKYQIMDFTKQIIGSLNGGMIYLSDIMGSYRFMAEGSWTKNMYNPANEKKYLLFKKQRLKMLEILDEETNYKYTKSIEYIIKKEEYLSLLEKDQYKLALSKEYKIYFRQEPVLNKIKILIKYYLPFLYKIKRKIATH